ncbi:MAG: HU family DNA-binding protein [Pseudomonadota bacterium]
MSENKSKSPDQTVQLTPEAAGGTPKMAVVTPGPRAVKVQVPTAQPVQQEADAVIKTVASAGSEAAKETVVKKGDLLDHIVAVTGVKRADAKSVSEALLAALSDHLQKGTHLQLPPLGKLRLVNTKDVGKGALALTVKIRTPNPD